MQYIWNDSTYLGYLKYADAECDEVAGDNRDHHSDKERFDIPYDILNQIVMSDAFLPRRQMFFSSGGNQSMGAQFVLPTRQYNKPKNHRIKTQIQNYSVKLHESLKDISDYKRQSIGNPIWMIYESEWQLHIGFSQFHQRREHNACGGY